MEIQQQLSELDVDLNILRQQWWDQVNAQIKLMPSSLFKRMISFFWFIVFLHAESSKNNSNKALEAILEIKKSIESYRDKETTINN